MIFFDLDDTILDTFKINIEIFERVRKNLNLDIEKDEFRQTVRASFRKRMIENFDFEYDERIGIDPLDYLFLTKEYERENMIKFKDKVYNDVKEILQNTSKEDFYHAFFERRFDYTTAISGMRELIEQLKKEGFKLGVITDGLSEVQHGKVDSLKMKNLFDFVFASADCGYGKPNPKFFRYAIEKSKCKVEESIMIGNNINSDVFGALAVGLNAIYFGEKPFNYKVNVAKDAVEIREKIKKILKK